MNEPLLSPKQIAAEFGKSTRWVYDARRAGFQMPGGVATVSEVRRFLVRVPNPTVVARKRRGY